MWVMEIIINATVISDLEREKIFIPTTPCPSPMNNYYLNGTRESIWLHCIGFMNLLKCIDKFTDNFILRRRTYVSA